MATVYLIHLDRPIRHSRHYLGYCANETLEQRLHRHKTNNGAVLLREANNRGITYNVIRTWNSLDWKSARTLERKLKSWHNSPRLCPICNSKINGDYNHE